MRPSKEAQDQYFRENGLDPWGYDTLYVKNRLHLSLCFLERFVPQNFAGTIVEIGAFNGDFTREMARAFPAAKIIASDLVKAPWEASEKNKLFPKSVSFQWADMLDFVGPDTAGPTILVMMECLYYVEEDDRPKTVESIIQKTSPEIAFLSAPWGRISELEFADLMSGYQLADRAIVSRIPGIKAAVVRLFRPEDPQWIYAFRRGEALGNWA